MTLPVNSTVSVVPVGGLEVPKQGDDRKVRLMGEALAAAKLDTPEASEQFRQKATEDYDTELRVAKGELLASAVTPESVFQGAIADQSMSFNDLQFAMQLAGDKRKEVEDSGSLTLNDFLMIQDPNYGPSDIRLMKNMEVAEARFLGAMEGHAEDSYFTTAIDFVDREILREGIGIGVGEKVMDRTGTKGAEILDMAKNLSEEEFDAYISDYIEELKSEGILVGNNFFALEQGLKEVRSAGYNKDYTLDLVLAAPDIVGIGGAIKQGTKAALKSFGSYRKAAAIVGPDKAAEVAAKGVRANPTQENISQIMPKALDTDVVSQSRPKAVLAEITQQNQIVQEVNTLIRKGSAGKVIDEAKVAEIAEKMSAAAAKRIGRPVRDYGVSYDMMHERVLTVSMGTAKGTPYKTQKSAEKAAKGIPEVTVVPTDGGYVLRYQERLKQKDFSDGVDLSNPYGDGLMAATRLAAAKVFGSAYSRDDLTQNALAMMGEASVGLFKKVTNPFIKDIEASSYESKAILSKILEDLRDGPDAGLREFLDDATFTDKFKSYHPTGAAPTKADIDAYRAVKSLNDAAYIMKASSILQKYVDQGYKAATVGNARYVVRPVDSASVPADATIFDPVAQRSVKRSTITDKTFYKYERPINGHEYMVKPDSVEILDHTDVLGYNSGGSRTYENANYFVTINNEGYARAVMTAFTEADAKLASKEIDTLLKAQGTSVKALEREAKGPKSKAKPVEGARLTDELVQANNSWNPAIETADDFIAFAKENNWKVGSVSWKGAGNRVVGEEVDKFAVMSNSTMRDMVMIQQARGDAPLIDFGGKQAATVDPINSILSQYQSGAYNIANMAYVRRAADEWVAAYKSGKASGVTVPPEAIASGDNMRIVREAKITGKDMAARRMGDLQAIILRRTGFKDKAVTAMEEYGASVAEFVFNKTGLKVTPKDPTEAVLKTGFGSKFGFCNPAQFIVQGAHIITLATVVPQHAIKGIALMAPIRMLVNGSDEAAKALTRKRLAKFTGESEDTFLELEEYYKTNGYDIIGAEAIENNTGVSYGLSSWAGNSLKPSAIGKALTPLRKGASKAYDASFMFYRAGEKLNRYTQINAAFFEYKKKFPLGNVNSDQGRMWMANRVHELGFHMTSASKNWMQEGFMRLPTQWLSFGFRALESVTLGRTFTPAEKAKLFVALGAMWGLDPFGLGSAADSLTDGAGLENDSFIGRALKYGIIDAMFEGMTDYDSAFGTRLSPVGGFLDMLVNWQEEEFVSVVAGPSAGIVTDATGSVLKTLSNLWTGNTTMAQDSLISAVRNISTFDNMAKAVGIYNWSVIRSKSGTEIAGDFDWKDAMFQATGFTPLEVTEYYRKQGEVYKDNKKVTAFRKEMDAHMKTVSRLLQGSDEDIESAQKLLNEVMHSIEVAPISEYDKQAIRKGLLTNKDSGLERSLNYLLRRDLASWKALNSMFNE